LGADGIATLRDYAAENSSNQLRYLGSVAHQAVRKAISAGDMADLTDVEGGAAAAIRYAQPLLAMLPLIYDYMVSEETDNDLEEIARGYLSLDASGAIGWYVLAQRLFAKDKDRDDAINALKMAIKIDPDAQRVFRILGSKPINRSPMVEIARSLCNQQPAVALNWVLLATSLFGQHESADEQLGAAREAVKLSPENNDHLWLLANSLLFHRQFDEGLAVSGRWLSRLSIGESIGETEISNVCTLLRGACVSGIAREMLSEIDAAGVADRLRPAREALAAAAEGSIEVLNGVAPEIRRPALELLARIDPKLADRALPGASL
jgi:tetratricopeptide (TPR) repeat protein